MLLAALTLAASLSLAADDALPEGGAAPVAFSGEVGQQTAVSTTGNGLTKLLFYTQPEAHWELGPFTFDASLRLFTDTEERAPRFDRQSKPELYATFAQESWKLTAGLQEVAWGETFGIPGVDVVNPRDYTDPLIQEPSWERLPVLALNGQVFLGKLTLQGVLTPVTRDNRYPSGRSPELRLGVAPAADVTSMPEYGGRASYLFENGIDLGLIYYRHWSRNAVYELTPALAILPVEDKVHSVGGTFSYAIDSLVLRGDALYSTGLPLAGLALGQVERDRSRFQGTMGGDLTTEGEWTFGLQYQAQAESLAAATRDFHWASAKVSRKLFDGQLEPEIFLFYGLDNPDRWLQPRVSWRPKGDSESFGAWSLELRADLLRAGIGPNEGALWLVRDESRLLSWISFRI